MPTLLPFGTEWPMHGQLRERAVQERGIFRSWVAGLDVSDQQERVLNKLLELMDEREFVEGRAACVTYEAELARRTGLGHSLGGVLADLKDAFVLTSHRAAEVFEDARPGVVLRIRRPGVVLTVEAAGPLRLKDSLVRNRAGGLS
ncbi:hypothetical protein [Arthrobacter sp. ISL-69]|uniref:hypothetical protein n=1 Tax=Arthrobacter sp. ISL-69 TaxID=2819113 RepID=UPI001BE80035|nr:hypothetical protein [Arthrobacter sp. ISL-69]MBT2538838.1 hypothetical protein [Arthrobacter sp. ISL-69]